MVKIGEKVTVVGSTSNHRFTSGMDVLVIRQMNDEIVDCVDLSTGDCSMISINDLKTENNMKIMKQAVLNTALRLCKANNQVTTLEIKVELMKTHPYFHWIQNTKGAVIGVSDYMDQLQKEGHFTFTTNGTYRIYTAVGVKPSKRSKPVSTPVTSGNTISRQRAFDMMANNKGHFFTATFVKQNGDMRTINCQYLKTQTGANSGYVMVREAGKMKQGVNAIRQINLQTLQNIRIGGQNYVIK